MKKAPEPPEEYECTILWDIFPEWEGDERHRRAAQAAQGIEPLSQLEKQEVGELVEV